MTIAFEASSPSTAARTGLHRFVWRWHFYAGLFVAPVVILLSVTGALYLFRTEIERVVYSDLMVVPQWKTMVPVETQEAAVKAAFPGSATRTFVLPRCDTCSARWVIRTAEGEPRAVFVDPGGGAILGDHDPRTMLMQVVRDLHGGAFFGDAGGYAVELAACWLFILLVTGLYLWWPRRKGLAGAAYPRLGAKGRRFWRDLHGVPAAWNAALVAFLILTGLPWSIFWGKELASLGTLSAVTVPTPNFMSQPKAPSAGYDPTAVEVGHDHGGGGDAEPWSIRHAPHPQGGHHHGHAPFGMANAYTAAQARGIAGPGLRIMAPQRPGDTWVLSFIIDQAQDQRTVNIDPADGTILRDVGWDEYSTLGQVVEFGIMTHMGNQFGLANQIVLLASCLILVATIVMGFVLWWRRRPKGRWSAPQVPAGFRPSWGVIALAIVLGIVFPLAGASMLAILAIEALMVRLRRQFDKGVGA